MRLIGTDAIKACKYPDIDITDLRHILSAGGIKSEKTLYAYKCGWNCALDAITNLLPTTELKHGHWNKKIVQKHSYAECSECKTIYSWSETETMRFCKQCGAKMDGVVE